MKIKLKSNENQIAWNRNQKSQKENSNLKGDIKTQLKVIENLTRFQNRHCKYSVSNKDKVNVNYKSDDLNSE